MQWGNENHKFFRIKIKGGTYMFLTVTATCSRCHEDSVKHIEVKIDERLKKPEKIEAEAKRKTRETECPDCGGELKFESIEKKIEHDANEEVKKIRCSKPGCDGQLTMKSIDKALVVEN